MKQPPSAGASSPSILSATLAGTPGGQAARPLVSMDKPVTFDGLVPSALLRSLHGDMRDRSTFAYGRVSNLSDESIKAWGLNVVHECRVMIPEHMRTCMLLFRLVEDKLMEAGLMTANWRMYRIGFDARTEGQHGYIHPDHTAGNMLSVLYYVNSEWRPEWHGQTCFYADGPPICAISISRPLPWITCRDGLRCFPPACSIRPPRPPTATPVCASPSPTCWRSPDGGSAFRAHSNSGIPICRNGLVKYSRYSARQIAAASRFNFSRMG